MATWKNMRFSNLEDYTTTSVENVRMNGKKLEINLDRVMHLLMSDRLVN